MADTNILTPVEGDDACGDDLKWDVDFMAVMQEFDALFTLDREGVVAGETVAAKALAVPADLIARAEVLCERTKDLRLLAVRAEALWRTEGLSAFADSIGDVAAAIEKWPDPTTGIHPRADEFDGDLGERAAPVVKLFNQVPVLAATVAWGGNPTVNERQAVAASLRDVFDSWTARLEPALGSEVPPGIDEAWTAINKLLPESAETHQKEVAAEPETPGATAPTVDAWELIERAAELMAFQDRHSPALPVLYLLLMWRSRGILEIAEGMKVSGVTMEQFLDSLRKQLAAQ